MACFLIRALAPDGQEAYLAKKPLSPPFRLILIVGLGWLVCAHGPLSAVQPLVAGGPALVTDGVYLLQ